MGPPEGGPRCGVAEPQRGTWPWQGRWPRPCRTSHPGGPGPDFWEGHQAGGTRRAPPLLPMSCHEGPGVHSCGAERLCAGGGTGRARAASCHDATPNPPPSQEARTRAARGTRTTASQGCASPHRCAARCGRSSTRIEALQLDGQEGLRPLRGPQAVFQAPRRSEAPPTRAHHDAEGPEVLRRPRRRAQL